MEFGIYVTPKKGATVPRFGAPRGTYIGAKRGGKQIEWDEGRIVAIPVDEYRRFRAEYDGAIADGSLRQHKAEAYEAQVEKRKEASAEAKKKAESDAKKRAEEAAKAETDAAQAAAEPSEAKRVHAIAETGATAPAPAAGERPRPVTLAKGGE